MHAKNIEKPFDVPRSERVDRWVLGSLDETNTRRVFSVDLKEIPC